CRHSYNLLWIALVAGYQLALITPGTSPASASFRKQILHNLNLRKNPRGRPQRKQRFRWRQANLGFLPAAMDAAVAAAIFSSLAIFAVVAMVLPSYCARKGIPR